MSETLEIETPKPSPLTPPKCDHCSLTRVAMMEMKPGRDGLPWWLCSFCWWEGRQPMKLGRVKVQSEELDEPKPKVRPYAPAEIAQHFGRKFIGPLDVRHKLQAVHESGICSKHANWFTYDELAKCTWADTGEPCGVLES